MGNISETGKTPLIEKVHDIKASALPTKVFKRPPKAPFYSVKGDTILQKVLQVIVVLSLILVPILLVKLFVYPIVQSVGNLPYYDCT